MPVGPSPHPFSIKCPRPKPPHDSIEYLSSYRPDDHRPLTDFRCDSDPGIILPIIGTMPMGATLAHPVLTAQISLPVASIFYDRFPGPRSAIPVHPLLYLGGRTCQADAYFIRISRRAAFVFVNEDQWRPVRKQHILNVL
jgi:hypothetical protein